uniref:Uncharacterized protein n=1 Tax=Anguilla anguilla TaxID=7936 RepID=A0A0E9WUP7_ANGAN
MLNIHFCSFFILFHVYSFKNSYIMQLLSLALNIQNNNFGH